MPELKNKNLVNKVITVNKMYPPEIGGVEFVAQQIAKIVNANGYKSEVITFNRSWFSETHQDGCVIIHRIKAMRLGRSLRIPFGYLKLLKKKQSDNTITIYHYPSFAPEIMLLRSKKNQGRWICLYHADIVGKGIVGKMYEKIVTKRFLNHMNHIVATSPNIKKTSNHLKKRKNVTVIPLGVDIQLFNENGEDMRREIMKSILERKPDVKSESIKVLLYVGRMARYKGVKELVSALSMCPDTYYLVVISSDDVKLLMDYSEEHAVSHRVLIYQHVLYKDLPKFYRSADIVCMPSTDRGEAFGLVALEAMACGIPVITTELGTGTSYHNINGTTGLVIRPRDERALFDGIMHITNNKQRFIPQEIRKRAVEFSMDEFEKKWISFLREESIEGIGRG